MDVFAALADPVRRLILTQLADGPRRVADLAADQPISRPAISRHLRVLTEAGLAAGRDVGRERHYRLATDPLQQVRAFLDALDPAPAVRAPIPASALDALDTEVRRTSRERRADAASTTAAGRTA